MVKNEEILGFVAYDGERVPFLFEDGVLKLFPNNEDKWNKFQSEEFEKMFDDKPQEDKWVGSYDLSGIMQSGQNVLFHVSEDYSSNNGFIQFRVIFLAIFDEKVKLDAIEGMVLSGNEINYYVPPSQVFKAEMSFNKDTNVINAIKVEYNNSDFKNGGEYTYKGNKISISFNSTPSLHFNSHLPLAAKSEMILSFKKPADLQTVIECYYQTRIFFKYISYRRNIEIDAVQLFMLQDGKKKRCGELFFMPHTKYEEETHKNKSMCIIQEKYLGVKAAAVFSKISDDEIYTEHICNSIDSRRSYTISRQILLFSAFEREFNNLYGKNYQRSKAYLQVKEETLKVIDDLKNKHTGRKKKYIKGIYSSVSKIDISLSEKVKFAIMDCQEIMIPFIKHIYCVNDSGNIIDGISDRLNSIRNDIVHANLWLEPEPVHLKDYKTIEILLYVMLLNGTGLEKKDIQRSIADLFQIHKSF